MDPLAITSSLLVVWFIQNFSIASQEAAKEIGKGAGKGIVATVRALVTTVYDKLKATPSSQAGQLVHQIEQENQVKESELASIIDQLTQIDINFAKSLDTRVQVLRNTLLNILDSRFTARDLNEIYFRLGLDADKLAGIGVPHKTKAEELLKYIETRHQLADLVQKMIEVNPSIV
jgi:hypothetical protein